MRKPPSRSLTRGVCQSVEESKVAFSVKTRGPPLVEPLCTSIVTSFTGRLAGVPVHVGWVVPVCGGPMTQVQLTVEPTQYVRPSEPVCVPPESAWGDNEADVNVVCR